MSHLPPKNSLHHCIHFSGGQTEVRAHFKMKEQRELDGTLLTILNTDDALVRLVGRDLVNSW